MIRPILAAVAALFPVSAIAHDGLTLRDAYARSSNPQVGAVFLVVENHKEIECRLVGAASEAAERVELHTHAEKNGVMTMMQVDEIAIPAGSEHALARGGDHVMLMGLKEPLASGDTVTLTLDFGDCGTETVEAELDNDRTDAPAADGHMGH